MSRLLVILALSILSMGFILDRTDDTCDYCIDTTTVSGLTRSLTRAPIRVHYELVGLNLSVEEHSYLVNDIIPRTQQFLASALSVNSLTSNLNFSFNECAGADIPNNLSFQGFSGTDFVVFLTGWDDSSNYGSWSHPCAIESDNQNHPVAGRIWINTNYLTCNDDGDMEDNVSNMIHQTLHLLGFHSSLYQYWTNSSDSNNAWAKVYDQVTIRGKCTYALHTTGLVTQAQAEFGTDLTFLELEVAASNQRPGSNWEKRIMYNDVMTRGVDIEGTIISKITLAAMQDSGWYDADLTQGQLLAWGRNQGDDFLENKCVYNGLAQQSEFCTDFGQEISCDVSHTHVGRCNLMQYDEWHLPPYQYRYFFYPSWGGADQYMDFCPFVAPFTNGDCRDENNNSWWRDHWGEALGANSRCIEGTFAPSGYYPRRHGGCHTIACDASTSTFTITIGDQTVTCSTTGEQQTLSGAIAGSVTCPSFEVVCGDVAPCLNNCQGRGTCSGGLCTCNAGWYGTDCSDSCDISCASCSGYGTSACTACNGDATVNVTTGACDCSGIYVVTTGNCLAALSSCPLGTVSDGSSNCIVPTSVAAEFDFSCGCPLPFTSSSSGYSGYFTGVTASASSGCAPYIVQDRGLYFDATAGNSFTTDIEIYNDFTVEMWVKPTDTGNGSLFNWEINRGYSNGNLWVTSCGGLALDYATQQISSSPNSLSTTAWSKVSLKICTTGATTTAAIYINAVQLAAANFAETFTPPAQMSQTFGSLGGYAMFYDGFFYSVSYYEYCLDVTINTTCNDANSDGSEDCSYCLDDGSCINNCGMQQFIDDSYTCQDCTGSCACGCNTSDVCTSTCNDCATSATACTGNCATCAGAEADDCWSCNDGFELDGYAPSTCSACTTCNNTNLYNQPAQCSCTAGTFWNALVSACYRCHYSCATCSDVTNTGCLTCANNYFIQPGTGLCGAGCPSGYDGSNGQCVASATIDWAFSFDSPANEFVSGAGDYQVKVTGGYLEGDTFIDDPYPISGRGVWFDGYLDHFEVANLNLCTSFTLDFFLYNQMSFASTGSLFANYRSPYSYAYGSLFNFKIRNSFLAFTETSGLSLVSTGSISVNEWTHVALSLSYSSDTTSVNFYRNGSGFGAYIGINSIILDNSAFSHYVGGIRHNMRLYDAFRGYIYQFNASQQALTDFSGRQTDSCTGTCTVCPADGTCLSLCAYNQSVETDGSCTTCATSSHCNICGSICESCTAYTTSSCP